MDKTRFKELSEQISRLGEVVQEYQLRLNGSELEMLRLIGAVSLGASLEGTDEATGFYACRFAVRERKLVIRPAAVAVHYRGFSYPNSRPKQPTQRGRIRAHRWIIYTRKDVK